MRALVPFRRWHYNWLVEQGEPGDHVVHLPEGVLAQLETQDSWTAVVDNDPVAAGGLVQHWPGRFLAWTYMGPRTAQHMRWLTRLVREHLKDKQGRFEMTVRADFRPGQRWAEMLGFQVETPVLRQYGPSGEDHIGYVRIQ